MFHSSWLLGSIRGMPTQYFAADGVGAVVPGGTYYLSTILSLIQAFSDALDAAGVADVQVSLTRSRHVRVIAGEPFAVTWGASGTLLRDLLGYTGDLPDLGTHQAPRVSPLLWSPARPSRSELSPLGTRGIRRPLSYYAVSPSDGSTSVITHGAREFQRLTWLNISNDRIFTVDELGGEFVRFFDQVLSRGASLMHIPDVLEEQASSVSAVLTGPLGPYVFSPAGRAATWVYDRSKGFEWTDRRQDIDLNLHVVPQYPT